jgi:hypothetical protein
MAAIPLTPDAVKCVKRTLVGRFPKDSSSHLSEALAAALGFNTNISLVNALNEGDGSDPDYQLLDERPFLTRLEQIAKRRMTSADRSLNFDYLRYPDPSPVVRTRSDGGRRVIYTKSVRKRAWRNAMVAVINEGIQRRLFSIKPGDNRWPGAVRDERGVSQSSVFEFDIDGIPAVGSVHDGGYDELSLHVALWPTQEGKRWVECVNAGFLAGDVWAAGWLERREGAWLQVTRQLTSSNFSCRKNRLASVAELSIEPRGYADRGSFKL